MDVTDSKFETGKLRSLKPGSIKPAGWLKQQLRIQADGLSGHLDEFWPDIKDSGWTGGNAEGWERVPYWLDGLVPLAWLLEDQDLQAKVTRTMDYILDHPYEDGWLGPNFDHGARKLAPEEYDHWPVIPLLKAFCQYHAYTEDARIIPVMTACLRRMEALLDEKNMYGWGQVRWVDLALVAFWLHEQTGEEWLLDLVETAEDQGFDWELHFLQFPFTHKSTAGIIGYPTTYHPSHVVNNAMGLKQPTITARLSGDPLQVENAHQMLGELDRYHGQVTGVFSGDEHLAGTSPSQGTELCAVVEMMFSLEALVEAFGDVAFADRLEQVAYNALPATFSPDMWAHQYVQQANQVVCRISEDRVYTNNGPDANLFGLEPNFGCCTANMHQGWPKFANSLWMQAQDGALTAVAYAPCQVETTGRAGQPVTIEVTSNYPFGDTVSINVSSPEPQALDLRIPAWCPGAKVTLDNQSPVDAAPGDYHRVEVPAGSHTVLLEMPMPLRVRRGYNQSVSILRGPLVYALPLGEEWVYLKGEKPHADYEVFPTTPWNYALALDLGQLEQECVFEPGEVGSCPFSPTGAPVSLTVKGRRLPAWVLERNAAAPPPHSPVKSEHELEELHLIPYGCTNLRVSEFPLAEE